MSDFGTVITPKGGNLGNGLKFNDGIPNSGAVNKQYVRVEPNNDTYIAGSGSTFSVYCIFNPKAYSSTVNMLVSQQFGVVLFIQNNSISFLAGNDTTNLWLTNCSTNNITLNKTHHICGIKKSETNSALFVNDIDIYLDNDKIVNTSVSGDLTQFYTLAQYTGGTGTILSTRNTNPFNLNHQGYIMQVSMFKKALSREEVDYMYRMEGAIPESAKDSLALNLLFNENKGTMVRDYSPYRNHGTMFNYTGNTATLGSNNHFVDAYTLKPITQ